MGQAKRRGTFEERLAKALAKDTTYQAVESLKGTTFPKREAPKAGIVGTKSTNSLLVLVALAASLGTNKR